MEVGSQGAQNALGGFASGSDELGLYQSFWPTAQPVWSRKAIAFSCQTGPARLSFSTRSAYLAPHSAPHHRDAPAPVQSGHHGDCTTAGPCHALDHSPIRGI